MDLTGQQKLSIKRLMNACVCFIFSLRMDDHISHYYGLLCWLTADDRRKFQFDYFLYSILKTGTFPS